MKEEEVAMSDTNEFEAAMARALDRKPEVAVPVDFAARVRASLPAQPKVKARRSVGREVGIVAVAGLVLALCVLAPHTRPSLESVAFDLEMVLVVELMGVAAWLGTRRSDG
jgi:hypothetical protein